MHFSRGLVFVCVFMASALPSHISVAQCMPGYYCGPGAKQFQGIPRGRPSNTFRGRPIMGPMPGSTPMYIPQRRCYASGAVDRFGNQYVKCY